MSDVANSLRLHFDFYFHLCKIGELEAENNIKIQLEATLLGPFRETDVTGQK